jgi:hypothetical protein
MIGAFGPFFFFALQYRGAPRNEDFHLSNNPDFIAPRHYSMIE